jgi:hypothetical protein
LRCGADPIRPPIDVPLKPKVEANTPVPAQILAMPAEEFFRRLNRLLVSNPPYDADRPVMNRIARLGIVPGAAFSMAVFPPDVRAAIQDARGRHDPRAPPVCAEAGRHRRLWTPPPGVEEQ